MSQVFWQAKIWGLLHDPALKALHNNTGRGGESIWQELAVMADWRELLQKDGEESSAELAMLTPKKSGKVLLKWIADADLITSASDRSAIGSLNSAINYGDQGPDQGLEISHLLSGAKIRNWKLPDLAHQELMKSRDRAQTIRETEQLLFPQWLKDETDPKKVFWWLWRCLPEAACQAFDDPSLLLMPAETRIPDGSIWSHTSMTAALSSALAGQHLTSQDLSERWSSHKSLSHAYLATFSFSPVQELIKASRKMRDFWAGSWVLHYLSTKVCWDLAQIYGPDSFLYPSLFQQPLIDYWLKDWLQPDQKAWAEFNKFIPQPKGASLLTAGFPNVIVIILPKDKVNAAMQTAEQSLKAEWRRLGQEVLDLLQSQRRWMPGLHETDQAWAGWLESQWQTYWSAVPIGKEGETLKDTAILKDQGATSDSDDWVKAQNVTYNLSKEKRLFLEKELQFLRATFGPKKPGVNVGSWWPYVFDKTRQALAAMKNARTWQLPTAFGPRSTISGLGPVVHPDNYSDYRDWLTEGDTASLWKNHVGVFDGIEELNATEVVKRCLHLILSKAILPNVPERWREESYTPDLTAGVAGWLRQQEQKAAMGDFSAQALIDHFLYACLDVSDSFPWVPQEEDWGIPWVKKHHEDWPNPRLLNAGWLIDDYEPDRLLSKDQQREMRNQKLLDVKKKIEQYFTTGNNPTDWYVLAVGDGDGMSDWLKGVLLEPYGSYVPDRLKEKVANSHQEREGVPEAFAQFLTQPKRMGPSTHAALSRALLDFSNQLVPYLTEQRYAGRLIYSGGDDVLAYTNLWEWDQWLWDIRQCFKGDIDPKDEFDDTGDYWRWKVGKTPENLSPRPLFTMGSKASISFGIIIAHHSVPLAIALENLWEAEEKAKEHFYLDLQEPDAKKRKKQKDAVQVRILYGNGNQLTSTAKFSVLDQWRSLFTIPDLDAALFEQAAQLWDQHPAPCRSAIAPWVTAFCSRREQLTEANQKQFQQALHGFLETLWDTTTPKNLNGENGEVQNWLKLAAFTLRKRVIKLPKSSGGAQ
ncbi:type III-B CRISPR-associated protein Cas10/Cmr2 [Prochlorothrix hollandica]|uniref:CRISPR-associated protein Crm2 n=1 Tax=Prochlorothrix hollandica PCC 9006 = CALU 1027 TaxID=317619 RepID=A0A0M2PZ39_PROHO|nr:CRISPR-associated protein Crm2 [Prochlorothrix hollandica PCC 9006 = CALU 1027]